MFEKHTKWNIYFHAHCFNLRKEKKNVNNAINAFVLSPSFGRSNVVLLFPFFHFFLYISRALLELSRDARLRDTYTFVSRVLLDLSHDARLRDTYTSVSHALLVKMKKTLKKKENNAVTASFSHFLRLSFIFHISRALLDLS